MKAGAPSEQVPPAERHLPPISELAIAIIALVVVGGIYMAAHLPQVAPLAPALVIVAVAVLLLLINVILLSQLQSFAWRTFYQVGGWALLAYLVIAGMLEFIFVFDHTRGSMLVLLSAMLAIFAVDVPMLFAFSVARYQDE